MKRRSNLTLTAVALLILGLVLPAPFNALTALRRASHPVSRAASSANANANAPTVAALARQPIHFEPSADQIQARFVARGRGYALKLAPTHAALSLRNSSGRAEVTMHLLNANLDPQMIALDRQASVSNYLIGNDPSKWRTQVPNFGKVKYEAIYRGIDLVYYGNQRQLEYDFLVAPGVDPAQIKLAFTGAEKLSLDNNGDLIIATNSGQMRQHRPVVYQERNGQREPVAGDFVIADNQRVSFALGEYDHGRALVIDPTLSYSTYVGDTNEDKGYAIAIDSSGNVFTTGETSSSGYPVPSGYDTSFNGTVDVFVTKVNTTGTGLSFSTFLGGSGTDIGRGVGVDSSGNVYVAGDTDSNSTGGNTPFPTSTLVSGVSYPAFQSTNAGGLDAFVTK